MLYVGARCHDYGRNDIDILINKVENDGFECIMLAMQKALCDINSYFDVTDELIKRCKNVFGNLEKKYNHKFINTLGVYKEIGFVDEEKRKNEVKEFIQGIRVASEIGIPYVASETTNIAKQPDVSETESLKALYKSLDESLKVATDLNVTLCIEPVFYHTLNTSKKVKAMIKDFRSDNLRVTFDAVNMFEVSDYDEDESLKKQHKKFDMCFDDFGEYIRVLHIKGIKVENNELKKASLEESVIDYKYLFDIYKEYAKNIDIHVIREELDSNKAKYEKDFIKKFIN